MKIGVLFKSGVEKVFSVKSVETDIDWDSGRLESISWEDLGDRYTSMGDNLPEFIDPNEVSAVWHRCD